MRVHIQTGGFVCMNCNAKGGDILSYQRAAHGQDFVTAAKALNAFREDGRPVKVQRPKPLPATAAIQVLAFESTLAAIAAGNIANGVVLTEIDRARLLVAARRINHVAEIFA